MQANEKVLLTILNRITARAAAGDADGLRAIIAAAEQGRDLAADALAKIAEHADTPGEEEQAERYMERERQAYISRETSELFAYVMAQGGIRPSSPDLAEEYREVPPSYRRRDGMPGDEMAEQLSVDRPELGITCERDLLEFFASRRRQARNERALAGVK